MSLHVLLVEDNPSVAKQLQRVLTEHGFDVTTASNGLDAFNKVQQHVYDICIIDHLMPLMDGRQLLKNISQLTVHKPAFTVFMSTQDLRSVEQLPEVQFADTLICKPIEDEVFIGVIYSLLEESSKIA
ncbi:response regulator [Thalassotalea maritima]|uniref:response regulator n=1 Tax=Thalassotalea maritima TaxID=3242416 RepID=UPI0035295796